MRERWLLLGGARSLHLGWVTAATLVNVNAWAGLARVGPSAALALVVLSHVGAVWLADLYARATLPVASGAVAWALFAVGHGVPIGEDAATLGELTMRGLAYAAQGAGAAALTLALIRTHAADGKGTR